MPSQNKLNDTHFFVRLIKASKFRFIFAAGIFGITIALLFYFFQSFPIEGSSLGIDWYGIWLGLHGGVPHYGTGLRNPPWSLLPLLPLGLLSFRSSWAALVLATILVEVVSIPHRSLEKIDLPMTIFLIISYPSLRNIADGNLEVLPIAGVLLLLCSYRNQNPWLMSGGILLASGKPQVTWLLLATIAVFVIRTWPRKKILVVAMLTSFIVLITSLLFGREWLSALLTIEARGSIMDISLFSTLARLGAPLILSCAVWIVLLGSTIYVAFSNIDIVDHFKAGLLISASLLLSPYAAGNSLLSIAAIGVVPLIQKDPKRGFALGILINLGYLAIGHTSFIYSYGAYYTTIVVFAAWCIFAWKTRVMDATILAA